jgi:hypothetical protein
VCTVPSRLRGPVCAYFPHHPPTPYCSHHPAVTPAAATTIVAPASPARAGLSRACNLKSPEAVPVASLKGGSYSAPPILIFLTSLPFPRTHHLMCLWPPLPFLTSPLLAIAHQTLPYHVCSSASRAEAAPAGYGPKDTEYLKDATAQVASLMVRMPEV